MPKKGSIATVQNTEPRRKNPIYLGDDSNLDKDFKPLKIDELASKLELSKSAINVDGDFTVKGQSPYIAGVTDLPVTALNNATENELVTIGSTVSELDAETNLTFDGTELQIAGSGSLFEFRYDSGNRAYISLTSAGQLTLSQQTTTSPNGVYVDAAGDITLDSATANIEIHSGGAKVCYFNGGNLYIKESSDADDDEAAYGQLWVHNDTPNTLWFTTDAGDDIQLTSGTSIVSPSMALNDLSDVTYSSGDLTISSLDKIVSGALSFEPTSTITIDRNVDSASAGIQTGLHVDFDRVGTVSTGLDNNTALNVTANSTGASGGAIDTYGIRTTVTGDTGGSSKATALSLVSTGADTNQGIYLKTDNDLGADLKIVSSADVGDYFAITVGTNGSTTIFTNDNAATAAHYEIAADGNITLDSAAEIFLEPVSGGVKIKETDDKITETAGYGQLWVKDDSPNTLWFTNDDDTDVQLTTSGGSAIGEVQVATITIDESGMNALHTTEQTIVSAKGSNKVIIPTSGMLFIDRDSSTAQGSGSANLIVGWGGADSYSTDTIYYIRRFMYNEGGDRIYHLQHYSGECGQSLTAGDNEPLTIKLDGAITSGSLDSMKVCVSYYVYDNS